MLFHPQGWEMGPAMIRHKSDEILYLQFDDLDADYKNYSYTIEHYDAHWQPTQLMEFEYIEGFTQDQIVNYSPSVNTVESYTQYTLEFPNQNMRPLLSGNYLLKVFLDGNPEELVFTRRFMIFEQLLPVEGTARPATIVASRDTHQQVSFSIDISPLHIANPYQDLKVVIRQNGRWDNAITDLPPRMIRSNRLIYDYDNQLLFHGGNEFRRFDIRSLRYTTQEVGKIGAGSSSWDVFLLPDARRNFRHYTTENDLNGHYAISTSDAPSQELQADYAWVHFSLPMDAPVAAGSVHVMGQLTQWALGPESEMTYNYRLKQYEARLLLKQGLYNYWYVYKEEGEQQADVCYFEGCHSETENDYSILVYYRAPGSLYDRLVSMAGLNTSVR
ncbi:MAG: DUF5103 domain-containing protein [Bacteroidales bacterium]